MQRAYGVLNTSWRNSIAVSTASSASSSAMPSSLSQVAPIAAGQRGAQSVPGAHLPGAPHTSDVHTIPNSNTSSSTAPAVSSEASTSFNRNAHLTDAEDPVHQPYFFLDGDGNWLAAEHFGEHLLEAADTREFLQRVAADVKRETGQDIFREESVVQPVALSSSDSSSSSTSSTPSSSSSISSSSSSSPSRSRPTSSCHAGDCKLRMKFVAKNVMSLATLTREDAVFAEIEGADWTAIFLSETWRGAAAEEWDHRDFGHRFIGAGGTSTWSCDYPPQGFPAVSSV